MSDRCETCGQKRPREHHGVWVDSVAPPVPGPVVAMGRRAGKWNAALDEARRALIGEVAAWLAAEPDVPETEGRCGIDCRTDWPAVAAELRHRFGPQEGT